MDWMKNKKTQNTIAIILAVGLILIFFLINTMIKKTIEETSEIVPSKNTQISPIVNQGPSKEIPLKASAEVTVKSEVVKPHKQQASTDSKDKEIIYEPSIKGNILLQ